MKTSTPALLSCRCFKLIMACALLVGPAASVLAAQEDWNRPHDYYAAVLQERGDLLRNVEKYHLPQGIEKMNQKRYRPAWDDFDFVLRYYPNHPRALLLISDLALRMQQPAEAEKYHNKAITLFPQYAATRIIYGIFLQKAGRLDDAIEQYRKALSLEPDASEAHYNLGLALFKKGNMEESLKHARRAYELGYPLPGLRDKLVKAGVWSASSTARHQERESVK